MKIKKNATLALIFLASTSGVFSAKAAEGCDAYPLFDGMTAEQTDRGPKIISTVTVAVDIDDQSVVLDAINEATLTAKAVIVKFYSEDIKTDEGLDKTVETSVKIVGDNKNVSRTELKKQLLMIRNSAQSILKGVRKIGDCYSKGKFVRVSVGVKPETVNAAIAGKQMMSSDVNTSGEVKGGTSNNLNGADGFNNSQGISNF